jgi:hypothetical protein
MSTPAPPPAPTDPLREQLDELDALLQRMLELPVNPAEGELTAPPATDPLPPPPVIDPRPPRSPAAELRRDEPALSSAVAVVEAPRPLTVAPSPRPDPAPAWMVEDRGSRIEDRNAPTGLPRSSILDPRSWVLWPLVGANRLFDRAVSRLGFAGRWMKRPWGRSLLGWVGLLCLAAAGVLLLLDWIGWTW